MKLLSSFLIMETKIQERTPTSIFYRTNCLRNAAYKIAVHTVRSRLPHHYQRMHLFIKLI
jgi:hypothetical protein